MAFNSHTHKYYFKVVLDSRNPKYCSKWH